MDELRLEKIGIRFGDKIFGLLAEGGEGISKVLSDGGDFGGGGEVGLEFDIFVWEVFDGVKVEFGIFVDGKFATLAAKFGLDGKAELGDNIGVGDIVGNRGGFDDVKAAILYVAMKDEFVLGGLVGLVDFSAKSETGEVGVIFVVAGDIDAIVLPIGGAEGKVGLG